MEVHRLGARRLRLRFVHGAHVVDLLAAGLTVPYRSGIQRLLAAEPDIAAVIVERIPRGFSDAAEEFGLSYLDLNGNGRVVAPGFVYSSNAAGGRPRGGRVPQTSPYAPKASRVVRTLLSDPERPWTLADLAERTGADPGNTHRALRTLVGDGYVERHEDRYTTSDPAGLLQAWAEASRTPQESLVLPAGDHLESSIRGFTAGAADQYAVSGELAAELLAPYLRAETAILHCRSVSEWERLLDTDRTRFSFPGDRRLVVYMSDERIDDFGSDRDGLRIVSPVQVYVDLYRDPGRGREAAEHLRSELLRF
jgi:hypothetical protein